MSLRLRAIAFSLLLMPAFMADMHIQAKDQQEPTTERKTDYRFRQKFTPTELRSYTTFVYPLSPSSVSTMRGDNLYYSKKKTLNGLQINPTGISFGVIETDKKGRKDALFFSTTEVDKKIAELETKKYGQPTALAYYPDGRRLLVASDKGLFFFDPRKMTLLDQMELPFAPTKMVVSDNGYFLIIVEGDKVVVYNLEEKRERRNWSYGVNVNDVAFNNGTTELAVLSADGALTIYDTRNFNIKNDIDDLGDAIACSFNGDGKYIAVATSPETIEVINLLRPTDRNTIPVETAMVNDIVFIRDTDGNPVLSYTTAEAIGAKRLTNLEPHYVKLISDEVDQKMAEWLKMMPGESMEEYKLRVNDETRARQRRLFEDEISTMLAGDLLAGQTMSLGKYDRSNQVLAISFSEMPTIYLPVPESDVTSFRDAGDLLLSDVQYGVLPDDTFEIIYAKVFNKADGKTYEYNNLERTTMTFLEGDDNIVSLDILQQQQMEELRLQELREKIVEEAKHNDLISNHTNITVDSKVVPDYDANGKKIMNYEVNFTYQVEPDFSAAEDFPPGKYIVDESGAASAMLQIVKEAFEGDFAQYIKEGKKLKVNISGTADATPIIRTIPYNGVYGDFIDEPIYENGDLTAVTVTEAGGVKENRQLAFLRAQGVKNFLENNVNRLNEMDTNYTVRVDVSEGKGSEFRRITANFVFVDVF